MTNAIQFIKDHGIDKAREVVEGAPDRAATHFSIADGDLVYFSGINVYYDNDYSDWHEVYFSLPKLYSLLELKRLVEGVDIINELGSLESAKANLFEMYSDSSCDWVHENARLYDYKHLTVGRVKQAIADYESIYSEQVK